MADDTNSTSAERLKGSVKEAIGKLTGDPRIEAEGQRQKRQVAPSKAKTSAEPSGSPDPSGEPDEAGGR